MNDLDTQRSGPGAEQRIIDSLALHGLQPDAPVVYQSTNITLYSAALTRLSSTGRLFGCSCSRKDLEGIPTYPGTCRSKPIDPAIAYSLASAVDDGNGVITEVLREADLLSATAAQI